MLHAIVQRKTRHCRAYLGERDGEAGRSPSEDEITSTVFGPLDFMAPEQVHRFWRSVLQAAGAEDGMPDSPPARAAVQLWPHKQISGRMGKGVEPDGHVRLTWGNEARADLLIEIKWRQPLYRENVERQLRQQWLEYLTPDTREHAWHLFITPHVGDAVSQECLVERDWPPGRLVPVTWLQLRGVLCGLAGGDDGLARWAATADRFLDRIGIHRFRGFAHLLGTAPQARSLYHPFYSGGFHGFHGFDRADAAVPVTGCLFRSFFQESRHGRPTP
jgi:hypothetical protein